MTLHTATGRDYKNAAEWWIAVERLAEARYGPVAGRFRHLDHTSDDARSAESTSDRRETAVDSAVRAPALSGRASHPSAEERPPASGRPTPRDDPAGLSS